MPRKAPRTGSLQKLDRSPTNNGRMQHRLLQSRVMYQSRADTSDLEGSDAQTGKSNEGAVLVSPSPEAGRKRQPKIPLQRDRQLVGSTAILSKTRHPVQVPLFSKIPKKPG